MEDFYDNPVYVKKNEISGDAFKELTDEDVFNTYFP